MKPINKLICLLALCLVFTSCTNDRSKDAESTRQEARIEEAKDINSENKESTDNKEAPTEDSSKKSRIITDHAGNEVEIGTNIKRIVIDQIPILSTYMAYHGGCAPYIVGYAGSLKEVAEKTVLKDIAPELLDADETVYGQSDLNIEEIIKLKPDVIFYNATNKDRLEQLKKTGIPCVGFATIGTFGKADPIERYGQWLKLLEKIFGQEGKTDKFLKAGNDIVEEVEKRIANIPENKKPSAMILWKYAQGVPIVAGKGTFGDFWLKRIGVNNAAGEAKGYAKVTREEIYKWDPEVLYLDGPGLLDISTYDVLNNKVDGFDFSNMRSVVDKRVYNTKLGMWNWLTPNPDAPLVLAWLAKSTYPEYFEDFDLNKIIKDYYKDWYKYDLTDEQITDMFEI